MLNGSLLGHYVIEFRYEIGIKPEHESHLVYFYLFFLLLNKPRENPRIKRGRILIVVCLLTRPKPGNEWRFSKMKRWEITVPNSGIFKALLSGERVDEVIISC